MLAALATRENPSKYEVNLRNRILKMIALKRISSNGLNESTTGADASVEALKLYHIKLTLAYSSLLALLAIVACQSTKKGNDRRDRC